MKISTRKAAAILGTAVLGIGMLGGAAFAAFVPAQADVLAVMPDGTAKTVSEAPKGGDKLKGVLDALVTKGVITQQQEDSILAAVKDAARGDRRHEEFMKAIFAKAFEQSAAYLGMTPADLKAKLPGTSLAAIANATPGKSRDGLVDTLTKAANEAIAKALADGKITNEQAEKAKAAVPEHVAKFVDHTWPAAKPKLPDLHSFLGNVMVSARDYLGITEKDLMTQLRSGKSLADIATATPGKSRDGLVNAITTAANTKIDAAQKDGKLTADQATALKGKVGEAVAKAVDHKGNVKAR